MRKLYTLYLCAILCACGGNGMQQASATPEEIVEETRTSQAVPEKASSSINSTEKVEDRKNMPSSVVLLPTLRTGKYSSKTFMLLPQETKGVKHSSMT